MNETPSSSRVHIAFFGRRNAGKSSLVNAVTGQNLSVVSDIKGTTTDPVYKAMELLPLGPVVMIDTPGFDDEGKLGELRVRKAKQVLNKTDIAILVLESQPEEVFLPSGDHSLEAVLSASEAELIDAFKSRKLPYIIVQNKCDLNSKNIYKEVIPVSAKTGFNINLLRVKIASLANKGESNQQLAADLIKPNDIAVLVTPIDKAAPKGRLILPQQQTIRDILEAGGISVVVRESELKETLKSLAKKPAIVITDSQVFAQVSADVPPDIPLTSFSILFARYKGWLNTAVRGAAALDNLEHNDKILICEGCTHHRQCDDIGTVKLPKMIKNHASKELQFTFFSGGDFPEDLSSYKLVVHCGACMLNEREMQFRRRCAEEQNIPFTNYGITMAHIQGILRRSIAVFNIDEAV